MRTIGKWSMKRKESCEILDTLYMRLTNDRSSACFVVHSNHHAGD
jgi:hypothetical protein